MVLAELVLVLGAVVGAAPKSDAVGFERSSEGVLVVTHFEGELAADEALATAEGAWELGIEMYTLPRDRRKVTLEVHVYLAGSPLAPPSASEDGSYGPARVDLVLESGVRGADIVKYGLPTDALRELANEVAEARRSCSVSPLIHPAWMEEGLTAWIAEQTMQRIGRSTGDGESPWLAGQFEGLSRLLADGSLPHAKQVYYDELGILPERERVALQMQFVDVLNESKYRPKLHKVLDGVLELEAGEGVNDDINAIMEKSFGRGRLDDVDKALREKVAGFERSWEEDEPLLEVAPGGWIQSAGDRKAAVAWRTDGVGKRSYTLTGHLTIDEDGGTGAVLLDRRDDGRFLAVGFSARDGIALYAMERYMPKRKTLEAVGDPLPVGEELPFAITVDGSRLHVDLRDERVFSTELEQAIEAESPWGLAAVIGSRITWRDLEVGRPRR